VLSVTDCIGNHGINGSRTADCMFYRTVMLDTPLAYQTATPRFYEDGQPDVYVAPYRDDQQRVDPEYLCEWDTKLVPRVWQRLKVALSARGQRRLKRYLPFL
jgi:hypothetical protein